MTLLMWKNCVLNFPYCLNLVNLRINAHFILSGPWKFKVLLIWVGMEYQDFTSIWQLGFWPARCLNNKQKASWVIKTYGAWEAGRLLAGPHRHRGLHSRCSSCCTGCTWSCSGTCSESCSPHHTCLYKTWNQLGEKHRDTWRLTGNKVLNQKSTAHLYICLHSHSSSHCSAHSAGYTDMCNCCLCHNHSDPDTSPMSLGINSTRSYLKKTVTWIGYVAR